MGRIQEGKSPAVTFLWPHHRSMARLVVAGARPGELADSTGMSPGQISRILQSPLFQAELSRLEGRADELAVDVHSDLKKMSEVAVEVLAENLASDEISRELKTRTAFDVLDRSGHGKKAEPQRHLHAHLHAHKEVAEMDERELYDNIQDMIQEEA